MDVKKTALLLIDMQKESKYGIEGMEEAVINAKTLLSACRQENIPVIYTRHISRADAIGLPNNEVLDHSGKPIYYCSDAESKEIIDEIKPESNDIVIDKHRWSGFYQTELDLILRSLGIKHLIMGGFVTDCCLMTSAFDAYARDYQVNIVKDICGATNSGSHQSSLLIMANWIYDLKIFDTEEIIKMLRGETYEAWECTTPDQMQFTPENMREIFSKLS
ncbi:isochorismatase [Pullulanibacillus camelliae]|uniref:Isochorismatase n=1 Tax=Pullulanibacillus camelliae TaxID=1707096 RepID=A0A8J2VQR8_9BACL|nr:isochorismatase family cysteine hydrolase [Pullulanibacillus camelliae]GGE35863.1 isochorismatase [Pullulanibacillus camelliae]